MRYVTFFVLMLTLNLQLPAEEKQVFEKSKTGTYVLTDFGETNTPGAAKKTMDKACQLITDNGGGVLIVPPGVTNNLQIGNTYQKARAANNEPAVTIVDNRTGFQTIHVPQFGKRRPGGYYGMMIKRTLNTLPSIKHWGWHSMLDFRSHAVTGAGSMFHRLELPAVKGDNAKIYPKSIQGIFVGQYLQMNPWGSQKEHVLVKDIGWDPEKKLNYFVADLKNDYGLGTIISNKNNIGVIAIDTAHNCDTQSFDFDVIRRQYAHGDAFMISGTYIYQGNVMSTNGDENGVVFNAEIITDFEPFNGVVESVDWQKNSIKYKEGKTNPQKLAVSRPLINMNPKKWITSGTIKIVLPDEWCGYMIQNPAYKDKIQELIDNGIDLSQFEMSYEKDGKKLPSVTTWDGLPIRKFKYIYKDRAYPSIIGKWKGKTISNFLGGKIIGSKDCGWTKDIIGRYFAINDPGEYVSPKESSLYRCSSKIIARRWYKISGFNKNPDGTCSLRIERIKYDVSSAGAPTLYDDENSTWDGHEKELKYIIAPGANVFDISKGWKDTDNGFANKSDSRTIKVVPNNERGTKLDFESGDKILQAIGPDPANPMAMRVREFNGIPSTFPYGTLNLQQQGLVTSYAGLRLTSGALTKAADIEKRKDKKPPFLNGVAIDTVTGAGIRFAADVTEGALVFEQPYNAQPLVWKHRNGKSTLTVNPESGDMKISGGNVAIESVKEIRGISATPIPANNLRGINVPVSKDQKRIDVVFDKQEIDTSYSVNVQPNWFTMDKVINKTPAGFTIEFSNPATDNACIDWQLIR